MVRYTVHFHECVCMYAPWVEMALFFPIVVLFKINKYYEKRSKSFRNDMGKMS